MANQSSTRAVSDNLRKDKRNVFAVMALFSGIASWVPLVIVMALPVTVVCWVLALVTAGRADSHRGVSAAWIGLALAGAALVLHMLVASLGGLVWWIGDLFRAQP